MNNLPQTVKNLPTDSLRMFTVLADLKSISKTAQVICRSQPAVSLQLKKLEDMLDTTLFHRNKGTFTLTRDGEILLDYAQQMLTINDNLLDALSNSEKRKNVRIGMPNDFIERMWSNILTEFRESHPNIRFEIYEDLSVNLLAMLHQNRLDIALALLPKIGGQYCTHFVEKELFWVGSQQQAAKRPLSLIACFNGCSYRAVMEAALKRADISYQVNLTSNNFYTIYDSIEQDLGVSSLMVSKRNLEEYGKNRINSLPDIAPLYLGLHIKSVNITKEISALTNHIKKLM